MTNQILVTLPCHSEMIITKSATKSVTKLTVWEVDYMLFNNTDIKQLKTYWNKIINGI
jgi:hypothetical protein